MYMTGESTQTVFVYEKFTRNQTWWYRTKYGSHI